MQVKQLIELGQTGSIKEVTVASNEEGYSLIASTDNSAEILRTALGEPKIFKNFDVLLKQLREANIHKCEVFNH